MSKKLELTGQKFNKLTVINFAYMKNKHSYWLCRCECGNQKIIKGDYLTRKGRPIKSCGCLRSRKGEISSSYKHGMRETIFYKKYQSMKKRCNNPKYKLYGGRGITVCNRWLKFENFRDDMYESYKEHKLNNNYTSIERINNNDNYCPENCKWATYEEQANNRRNNCLLTYKRQTLTASQWAKKLNINRSTFNSRLENNWAIKRIIETPVGKYRE